MNVLFLSDSGGGLNGTATDNEDERRCDLGDGVEVGSSLDNPSLCAVPSN